MRLGHKTDAKRRRYTDGSEKTPSFQHSNVNPGNNKVTCCRLGSAARKDTRFIESGASKTDTCSCHDRWQSQTSLRCNTNSLGIACPSMYASTSWTRWKNGMILASASMLFPYNCRRLLGSLGRGSWSPENCLCHMQLCIMERLHRHLLHFVKKWLLRPF